MSLILAVLAGAAIMAAAERWFAWQRHAGYLLALRHAEERAVFARNHGDDASVSTIAEQLRREWP